MSLYIQCINAYLLTVDMKLIFNDMLHFVLGFVFMYIEQNYLFVWSDFTGVVHI